MNNRENIRLCSQQEWNRKLRELKIAKLFDDPMVAELELWLKTHKVGLVIDNSGYIGINVINPIDVININV